MPADTHWRTPDTTLGPFKIGSAIGRSSIRCASGGRATEPPVHPRSDSVAPVVAPADATSLRSTLAHGQEEHRQRTGGSYQQHGDCSY
jgi:hypothetical protein